MLFKKKSVVQKLRERPDWYVRELPEEIFVPALGGHRSDDMTIALEDATLDDLAFAIVGIEAKVTESRRGLTGLRELYEQARKRGAKGTNTMAEVFLGDDFVEVSK
jgi:hypothetical protein